MTSMHVPRKFSENYHRLNIGGDIVLRLLEVSEMVGELGKE